jgi:N-acetylneuraminate synthase
MSDKMMQIAHQRIGPDAPPFVIAEMSGNHNQSLERALGIVEAAAKAGCHALKLQTYTPETMTIDCPGPGFSIDDSGSLWSGRTLYELYGEAMTPWDWHAPIFARCRELGLVPFSTPFDETAVDYLQQLDAPAYKIASFENTDLPLLRRVAATGKPLIVSTGMATLAELDELVTTVRGAGCRELVLLKCTSTYPASPENSNLLTIPHLRSTFGCEVGLSDHTMGTGVAVAAVALGATVIEKHFTLRRADGGVDSSFSMEPEEMARLVGESRRAWEALGRVSYGATEGEKKSLQFRRSLYVVADVRAGEQFSRHNVRAIRPGLGLPTKFLDIVFGFSAIRDVKRGTPLSWDLLR